MNSPTACTMDSPTLTEGALSLSCGLDDGLLGWSLDPMLSFADSPSGELMDLDINFDLMDNEAGSSLSPLLSEDPTDWNTHLDAFPAGSDSAAWLSPPPSPSITITDTNEGGLSGACPSRKREPMKKRELFMVPQERMAMRAQAERILDTLGSAASGVTLPPTTVPVVSVAPAPRVTPVPLPPAPVRPRRKRGRPRKNAPRPSTEPRQYNRQEMRAFITRYAAKRERRRWEKRVTYACRAKLALSRSRKAGRFLSVGQDPFLQAKHQADSLQC